MFALFLVFALSSGAGAYARRANEIRPSPSSALNPYKTCPSGYELRYDRRAGKYECACLKYHLYWPGDGLCYREYQQGPCPEGHR